MRSSKDAEGQKVLVCSDPATGPREKEHHPTRQNPTTCETNEFTMTHAEEKGRFAAVLRRTPNSPARHDGKLWGDQRRHTRLRYGNLRTTTSGVCLERACLHSRDLQQRGPRCVVEERGSHRLCPPGGAAILPPARHSPPGWHARPPVLSPGACKQQAQRFPPGPAALAHPRSRHPPLRKHLDHVNDLFLDLRHRTRRTCQTPHAGTSTLLFLMHSSGLQFNKARLPAER